MSSHHVVRDNQEPALLLLETEHAFEVVQELLEWSPSVIVHESQLDKVLTWGIKIDVVLLNETNEEEVTEKMIAQFPLKLIRYKTTESPLLAALHFLKAGNYPSLNIVTKQSLFSQLSSFESKMDLVLFIDGIRWSLVRAGHFEKLIADDASVFMLDGSRSVRLTPDVNNKIKIEAPVAFWIGEQL